jgi:DNA-directed RNA polymerase subunit H (RpoH/RPB5)
MNITIDINYFYRIYDTVHQMMEDRNFKPDKKKLTLEKYTSKIIGYLTETSPHEFMDKLSLTFTKDSKLLVYFFILDIKINKVNIEDIYEKMKKECNSLLLILKEKITPKVASIMSTFDSQVFYHYELVFNPLKHVLMPKYVVLSEEEKEKIYSYYKLSSYKQLPGIYKNQPIAKWFNLNENDVLKIVRKNGEIYYRCVRI